MTRGNMSMPPHWHHRNRRHRRQARRSLAKHRMFHRRLFESHREPGPGIRPLNSARATSMIRLISAATGMWDLVDVCALPDYRLEPVAVCAELHKPIQLQKPIATNLRDARQIAQLANDAGITLGVVSQASF